MFFYTRFIAELFSGNNGWCSRYLLIQIHQVAASWICSGRGEERRMPKAGRI